MPFPSVHFPLSLLILVFATTARAEQPGLQLRMQTELIPYEQGREDVVPYFIEADRIEGRQERNLEAEGKVQLRTRGGAIFADQLHLSIPSQQVTATGQVRFEKDGDVLTSDNLFYDLGRQSGFLDKPSYDLRRINARGQAERITMTEPGQFKISNATYTNCDVGEDDWYLRVGTLELDRERDVGVAHNTTVVFKNLPILYSPYLDFSLSGRRKSGLLAPTIGSTESSGFEWTQPFYWNMAANYDATLSPRWLSKRGILVNTEFRYLESNLNGEFRGEWLPDDKIEGGERWGLSWRHQQDFGGGFSGMFDLQGVSDDTYFTDLSDKISATSQTNLPREASLRYDGGWWGLITRVQSFQTLQDPLAPVTPPYARVPQILLQANRQPAAQLDLGLQGEFVDFKHPTLLNGQRQTLYPSVSFPLQNAYAYLTPKVGYHTTHYSFDDPARTDERRELPIMSIDSGMTFEREATFGGRRFVQTLEPRLYYLSIPFRDQDQLPNFDTAEADFSLAQIFTENQFTGGDRINDANQLSAAVTSRFIDPDTAAEQVRFVLGQRYYFEDQQVSLSENRRQSSKSDVLAAFSGRLATNWNVDVSLQYGASKSRMERSNAVFRYQPEIGKVLNFGYRFTRDSLEQLDLSSQWPIGGRWTGLGRWNYTLRDDRLLEGLAGLEYNAGCWAARFVVHRFVSSTQEYVNSLFLQLELNGVSKVGASPLDVLRQNVIGYTKTNEPAPNDYNPFPE
ncbi:MAG: LPS-assembly protein LptD [Burkholderiales bacterium]